MNLERCSNSCTASLNVRRTSLSLNSPSTASEEHEQIPRAYRKSWIEYLSFLECPCQKTEWYHCLRVTTQRSFTMMENAHLLSTRLEFHSLYGIIKTNVFSGMLFCRVPPFSMSCAVRNMGQQETDRQRKDDLQLLSPLNSFMDAPVM